MMLIGWEIAQTLWSSIAMPAAMAMVCKTDPRFCILTAWWPPLIIAASLIKCGFLYWIGTTLMDERRSR
jgi:hypothetical protein